MGGSFYTGLDEVGGLTLTVGGITPEAGVLDQVRTRNQAEQLCPRLSSPGDAVWPDASGLHRCDFPSRWMVPSDCEPKGILPSWNSIETHFAYSNQKSNADTVTETHVEDLKYIFISLLRILYMHINVWRKYIPYSLIYNSFYIPTTIFASQLHVILKKKTTEII